MINEVVRKRQMLCKTFYEVSRVVKFIEAKGGGCQGRGGEKKKELLFTRYRVSVFQDENNPIAGCSHSINNVYILNVIKQNY